MRLTAFFVVAIAFATAAPAAFKMSVAEPAPSVTQSTRIVRFFAFRSLFAQLDNHVVANLLTESPVRQSDAPLLVVTGEITRCGSETCTVPLLVRVSGAQGPVTMAIAVADSKGALSDVRHADCGTGACSVMLVLERGHNTVSVGVIDGLSQATAYTTLRVNANRAVARVGKSEWF
jgi:hypothetical protein